MTNTEKQAKRNEQIERLDAIVKALWEDIDIFKAVKEVFPGGDEKAFKSAVRWAVNNLIDLLDDTYNDYDY